MAVDVSIATLSTLNNQSILTQSNNNFTNIQTALQNALSLNGQLPNAMQSTLDMNSNQMINLPPPGTMNSPVRLQDLTANPTIFTNAATKWITPTGATGNGSTDDTVAIQSWLSSLGPGTAGYLPAGTYKITSSLTMTQHTVTIRGDGPYQSVLMYEGASTTIDILTFGNGTNSMQNMNLSGFKVDSTTAMTSGTAIHFKGLQRSQLRDIVAAGQDGTTNLFHGMWFDSCDFVRLDGFESKAPGGDGLRANGGSLGNADLFLNNGKVGGCSTGLRFGGNIGGVVCDALDVIGNGTNMVVDQSLVASPNFQLFFGKGCFFDTSHVGPCVSLLDPGSLSVAGPLLIFDSPWIASATTHGFQASSTAQAVVVMNGGSIINNKDDGINDSSAGGVFYNIVGTNIWDNGTSSAGYGINAVNASPAIQFSAIRWKNNASGDFSPNVLTSTLALWDSIVRTWTPTITFGGGSTGLTYTTQAGWYILQGASVDIEINIVLSNVGSSTGTALLNLPLTTHSNNNMSVTLSQNMSSSFPLGISIGSGTTSAFWNLSTNTQISNTSFTNTSSISGRISARRL